MAQTLIKFNTQVDATEYKASVNEAIGAVQSDVNQNEADADEAIASEAAAREAADTTETAARVAGDEAEASTRAAAISALQADVDQNEADADSAIPTEKARIDAIQQMLRRFQYQQS